MKDINAIFNDILNSKKYNNICDELIFRICQETHGKYNKEKEIIKSVKAQLHAIYGAFFSDKCISQAETLINSATLAQPIEQLAEQLLSLHISSQERLPYIKDFYKFIFSITGLPVSITDIGCAFNPFSIPYMSDEKLKSYYAFDIDKRLPPIINTYMTMLKLPTLSSTLDIVSTVPKNYSDITFLFKIVPVIEHQKKGKTIDILTDINSKHVVITFPTKSLTGKNKGMEKHYSKFAKDSITPYFNIVASTIIGNEYVVIIRKSSN